MTEQDRYRFYICDVFSETRFGGNQLAVIADARGLSGELMQKIAREFNFSESAFVLPGGGDFTRRVRIFTPTKEIPFAGHPNVGTAFVLAMIGEFGLIEKPKTVVFDEDAGPVAVRIEPQADGRLRCELEAPMPLTRGATVEAREIAAVLSLDVADIVTATHPPQEASVGLPFVCVEVRDRDALKKARINLPALERLAERGISPDIHFYARSDDEFDLRVRMFAPFDGVPEDAATGSANSALAGLLSDCESASDGQFSYRIAQGVEMGRPSLLEARTEKAGGVVNRVFIGGHSVLVSEGWISVGDR